MKNQKWNIYDAIKVIHRLVFGVMAMVIFTLSLLSLLWAEEEHKTHPEETITAVRVNPTPPQIDGILDDQIWQQAPILGDFLQSDPNEGEPATEKTTIQISYDDKALYVGVMCYDREPDKIVARLSRRDDLVESDGVALSLDPHHDHQTAYWFLVKASGVLADQQLSNDQGLGWRGGDRTWDGVWEAKVAKHEKGWSVEYKIPYHVLRFSPKEEYTWGVNVNRYISRKKEDDYWVLVRKGESGWVSRFGHLEGLKGIHPPTHLEIFPFTMGRTTFEPKSSTNTNGREFFSALGGDLRYGLTSSLSLNATINPDFGQVEADPAVLNLSVFETFFEERRPFFIEGSTIFKIPQPEIVGIESPSQLFYSRRIGKQPGRFSTPERSTSIDRPDATTILGAAKLSGKTASKISFGIVEAVTANEYATIERIFTDSITGLERTERGKHRLEPLTNFFIGRIQQDIRTNSTAGITMTSVNRQDDTSTYTAGVDSNLKWGKNACSLYTRLSGSRTGSFNDPKNGYNGYEALSYFSKLSGWFGGQAYVETHSPEFDVNDLGFMSRANQIQTGGHIYAQIQNPWALARRSGFNINLWSLWNYDGVNLKKGINFNNWHQLKNYWFFNFGVSREFDSLDDLETRGGPLMLKPAHIWYWFNLGTDSRKPISLWFNIFGRRLDRGVGSSRHTRLGITIRPASNIQFEIGPSYRSEFIFAQWVTNVDDNRDGIKDHFVFGELKSRVIDFTTRANVSFTPNLSLQLYLQPFVTAGDYSNFKELARPSSYEFRPYPNLDFNPDFSRRSLRSNMMLRWEYHPGSTLFVVWSQSRSSASDNPSFQPWDSVRDSFTDDGQNIFLVKLNYWLGI